MSLHCWKMILKPVFWQYSLAFVCVVSWTAAPSLAGISFTKQPENQTYVPLYGTANLTWNFTVDGVSEKVRWVEFHRLKSAGGSVVLAETTHPYVYPIFKNKVNISWDGNKVTLWVLNMSSADESNYTLKVQTTDEFYQGGVVPVISLRIAGISFTKQPEDQTYVPLYGTANLTWSFTFDGLPETLQRVEFRRSNSTGGSYLLAETATPYVYPDFQNKVDILLDGNTVTLWILNMSSADESRYSVEIHSTLTKYGIGVVPVVSLQILDKPTIQNIIGVPDPVCEAREVTLNCSASGNPSPYVAWIDVHGAVLQNSTIVTSYTITHVTRNDEGNYTCSASNTAGKDIDSTRILNVQYSARINILHTNHSVLEGSRVELNCSVEGDPPPYVAWINITDGSVLQNRTVNTSYVIPRVSSHYKGTYRCVTGNRCGNDSKDTAILDVYNPCQICESKNKSCDRRDDGVYCRCKPEQTNCTEKKVVPDKLKEMWIVGVAVVAVVAGVLVVVIVAVVVWKIKKKRSRKDRRGKPAVANGDEHKL